MKPLTLCELDLVYGGQAKVQTKSQAIDAIRTLARGSGAVAEAAGVVSAYLAAAAAAQGGADLPNDAAAVAAFAAMGAAVGTEWTLDALASAFE